MTDPSRPAQCEKVLRLLQASSCFDDVCASLPCACAESLAALAAPVQVDGVPIPLADHDEIGRKVLGQPWAIQSAIVTIAAHCTMLTDKHPTGDVADLAGCISESCLQLANALSQGSISDQESDGSGSPVADNPDDPTALSLQQGLDTSSIPGTAASPHGEGTDAASVANPEGRPSIPDGSPVSPGPSDPLCQVERRPSLERAAIDALKDWFSMQSQSNTTKLYEAAGELVGSRFDPTEYDDVE